VSTDLIVYLLTALAAVVIVLTRLRLGHEEGGAGRFQVGHALVNLHTSAGVLALVTWLLFLIADDSSPLGSPTVGIVALFFWWVVVFAGLLILVRWLPSHGRHAQTAKEDTWSEGPGLSVLAHVGMLVGVCVFTWAYLTSAV
jgi:preprotein translocase subunit SecG